MEEEFDWSSMEVQRLPVAYAEETTPQPSSSMESFSMESLEVRVSAVDDWEHDHWLALRRESHLRMLGMLACLLVLLLATAAWLWRRRAATPLTAAPTGLTRFSGAAYARHEGVCLAETAVLSVRAELVEAERGGDVCASLPAAALGLDQLAAGLLGASCAHNDAVHASLEALVAHASALATRCLRWSEDASLPLPVRAHHLRTHIAVTAFRQRADAAALAVLRARRESMKADAIANMAAALAADSVSATTLYGARRLRAVGGGRVRMRV